MSKLWIKLYPEILRDAKMGRLPDSQWRLAIELFLLAGDVDQEGRLPDLGSMAWTLRRDDAEKFEEDIIALLSVGIISQDEQGFFVTRFTERQAPDSGATRIARYRERDRVAKECNADVTPVLRESNDDVTSRIDNNRVEENREEKNRIDNNSDDDDFSPSWTPLMNAYCLRLKCAVNHNPNPVTWVKPFVEMQQAGATPEIITEAIDILATNPKYKIANPGSLMNTVTGILNGRALKVNPAQPTPYTPPPDPMIAIRRDHPKFAALVEGKAQ